VTGYIRRRADESVSVKGPGLSNGQIQQLWKSLSDMIETRSRTRLLWKAYFPTSLEAMRHVAPCGHPMYLRDLLQFIAAEENEHAALALRIAVQPLFIPRRARARAREAVP
jgi:hypothetical protein